MVKQIPLQNGMFALVDDEEYERCMEYVWNVSVKANGVKIEISTSKKGCTLHRFILNLTPTDGPVSHIDRNQLNCQKENLLQRNIKSANRNRRGRRDSSSKYKGVSFDKETQKWAASILMMDGKRKRIGRFINEDDAARAYNRIAIEQWEKDCFINIIGEDNRATTYEKIENQKQTRRMKGRKFASKYRGVTLREVGKPFIAVLWHDSKTVYIGGYDDEIEAAKAYDKKAFELHGNKAILNFPRSEINDEIHEKLPIYLL